MANEEFKVQILLQDLEMHEKLERWGTAVFLAGIALVGKELASPGCHSPNMLILGLNSTVSETDQRRDRFDARRCYSEATIRRPMSTMSPVPPSLASSSKTPCRNSVACGVSGSTGTMYR